MRNWCDVNAPLCDVYQSASFRDRDLKLGLGVGQCVIQRYVYSQSPRSKGHWPGPPGTRSSRSKWTVFRNWLVPGRGGKRPTVKIMCGLIAPGMGFSLKCSLWWSHPPSAPGGQTKVDLFRHFWHPHGQARQQNKSFSSGSNATWKYLSNDILNISIRQILTKWQAEIDSP